MPYIHCPHCSLSVFSAAAHATRDHCPGCGNELPPGAASRAHRIDLLTRTAAEMRRKGPEAEGRLTRRFERLSRSLAEEERC
jgi:hypothetical protein